MRVSSKILIAGFALALGAGLLWWMVRDQQREPTAPMAVAVVEDGGGAPIKAERSIPQLAGPKVVSPKSTLLGLPAAGTRAQRRVWVQAKYGPGEGELGLEHPQPEGAIMPPQGFAVTRDGRLLVLDSFKKRLVFFDGQGGVERTVPLEGAVGLVEVAVARDGTIVVVDDGHGVTDGLWMLDESGRIKQKLPQRAVEAGVYVAGNSVFQDSGLTSTKLAETTGKAVGDDPNLYADENGVIPGRVGPDGVSVLSAGIDNFPTGVFFVSLVRGKKPEHIFSRTYQAPGEMFAIPYFQLDGRGDIYVVVMSAAGSHLLCLDKTGNPEGMVELPLPQGTLDQLAFRSYAVVETGGLVYLELSDTGVTYEWFDCH